MDLDFRPGYAIPVALGILLSALFPASRAIEDPSDRATYRWIQLVTLVMAILGAKAAALLGDLGWPFIPLSSPSDVFATGRSITGALLAGFVTSELLKPLFGYRRPPNDRFAMILPFSIAIGRIGCLFEGCCGGRETEGWLAWPDEHGIPRHPTALYDLIFHLLLGLLFVLCERRGWLKHRLFAMHLTSYGVFRFLVEFLRDSRLWWGPFSAYHALSLAMVCAGLWGMGRRLPVVPARVEIAGA